jgi:hypothetical protein
MHDHSIQIFLQTLHEIFVTVFNAILGSVPFTRLKGRSERKVVLDDLSSLSSPDVEQLSSQNKAVVNITSVVNLGCKFVLLD